MTQPWEEASNRSSISFRKKVKQIIKAMPMAFVMVGLTYTCFIYMSLINKDTSKYNEDSV